MSYFMKLSAKEIGFFLRQVAEQRVLGKDWEAIAGEMKQPVKELREFLWEHDAELALQIRKARREHRAFCVDEAVEKLRQQCQSSNEKIRHSAANTILRLHMAENRHRESLRKARLKQSLPATKKSPSEALPRKEAVPQSIDFSQLPTNIQQQTTELAKLLQVKL